MTILRALSRSVKLPDRLPMTGSRGSLTSGGGMFASSGLSGMEAYRSIGAVYGPVRRICESVALTNWTLSEQGPTKGKEDRKLIDDATAPARHPATALWTQPNPFMSRRWFLFLQQLWQETAGGCYWLMLNGGADGDPFLRKGITADFELWPIRADKITPISDRDNYLAGYVYSMGIEKIPLPVNCVIPVGWPDPLDPLRFAGALQSIGTDLEAEQYASQYNRNTFLNDARPGGVIEFENPLSPDRFDELVMRWREQHQGLNNAKRVAIIEGGKWVETGQHNSDMQYLELRKLSREEVMFATGTPFAMMVTQDVNLANAQVAIKVYNRYTILPRLVSIQEPLNQRVMPLIGDNLTMEFDLPAPEDEAFDVYAASTGWLDGTLTQNEAREARGYDSIGTEGDRYIWEISGVAPTLPPPPKPPKKPTGLSYRGETKAAETEGERQMTDAWAGRLEAVRDQYMDLIESRR